MSRFTNSAALADAELEARIRATLQRHAEDIEPHQPPWSELVAQAGAVVLPLHGTELSPAHLKSSRRPRLSGPWVRPTLAAAVALTISLSAAVVIQGRAGDSTGPSDGEEILSEDIPDSPVIVAPGANEFDRATAVPLPLPSRYPVQDIDQDPMLLAMAYLDQWNLSSQPGFQTDPEPKPEIIPTEDGGLEVYNLWWSVYDEDQVKLTMGAVFVRPDLVPGKWVVVGAYTKHSFVTLSGVRRAGGKVSFTVNDYLPDPKVQVGINGKVLERDELQLPSQTYVLEDPAPGQVITIEVQHLIDDAPASITAMALAPAGGGSDGGGRDGTVTVPPTGPVADGS